MWKYRSEYYKDSFASKEVRNSTYVRGNLTEEVVLSYDLKNEVTGVWGAEVKNTVKSKKRMNACLNLSLKPAWAALQDLGSKLKRNYGILPSWKKQRCPVECILSVE